MFSSPFLVPSHTQDARNVTYVYGFTFLVVATSKHQGTAWRPSIWRSDGGEGVRGVDAAAGHPTAPPSGEREEGRQGDLIKTTSRPSHPELVGHSTFLSVRLPFPLPFGAAADSFAPGSPARRSSEMANSASGVAVSDECKLKFIELKSKRLHRFITYRMDDKMREIIVEKVGDRETSYEDFTGSLPENDCRFAIYDFDFTTAEDVPKSRIFYILWSPDTARVRSKMLYASSNEKFKRELDGIQVELQATDASDISIDAIKDRAR